MYRSILLWPTLLLFSAMATWIVYALLLCVVGALVQLFFPRLATVPDSTT